MSIVYGLLVVLHFVGLASLLGSYLVTVRNPRILVGMFHGALTQLVTGVAMVGLRSSGAYDDPDGGVNDTKMAVKLLVLVVITALVLVYRRRREDEVPAGVVHAIGGLTLLNIAIAVFW